MQFTFALVAACAALAHAQPFEDRLEERATSGPPSSAAGAANVVKDMNLAAQALASLSSALSANDDDTTKYTYDELVTIINYVRTYTITSLFPFPWLLTFVPEPSRRIRH